MECAQANLLINQREHNRCVVQSVLAINNLQ
jgi:hypothetical protein